MNGAITLIAMLVLAGSGWAPAANGQVRRTVPRVGPRVAANAAHATPEELAGIRRGLKDAREGRFATDEQIEELFKKHRPA